MKMTASEVLDALEARGVLIDIGACGCCMSPWVKIMLDGVLVFEEDEAGMGNIDDGK